jgi:cytochrome c peroxidase
LVANQSTHDVAVLDTLAETFADRVVGSFAVGSGPAGIAVDAAGKVAFVDNAFDGSVSRIDLTKPFDSSAPRYDASSTLVRALPPRYSAAALAGRKLFHDASSSHVTPAGVVACSTCHPGGGDDGLVWFIHTSEIPLKRRRTPHLGGAHSSSAPFHWDGEFGTMSALGTATIAKLMGGDGLLVDVDSLQAFVDEIVMPPVGFADDLAAVERGRLIFESPETGCATCHNGLYFTDNKLHSVLDPMSLSPRDVITMANTPPLRGVFLRAPYFHDGRSPNLYDLLSRKDAVPHGNTAQLSATDRDDLVAYLMSL